MARRREQTEERGPVPLFARRVQDIEDIVALVLCVFASKVYCHTMSIIITMKLVFF